MTAENTSVTFLPDSDDGLCNSLGFTAGHQSLPDAMLQLNKIHQFNDVLLPDVAEETLGPLFGMGDHDSIGGLSMRARNAEVHDTP